MRHAAGMARRAAAGKACDRKIETAPEEMHRACLAEEAGAELLEDAVGIDEDLQEAPDGVGIVGTVRGVFGEFYRIGQLVRGLVDGNGNAEFAKRGKRGDVEAGNGVTRQRKMPLRAVAGRDAQAMIHEVEIDLKCPRAV